MLKINGNPIATVTGYTIPGTINHIKVDFVIKPSLRDRLIEHWGIPEMEQIFNNEIFGFAIDNTITLNSTFSTLLTNWAYTLQDDITKGYSTSKLYDFMINIVLTSPHTKLDFLVYFALYLKEREDGYEV